MRKWCLWFALAGGMLSHFAFGVVGFYDFNIGKNLYARFDTFNQMTFGYFNGASWVHPNVQHFEFDGRALVAKVHHPTAKGTLEDFWITISIVEEPSIAEGSKISKGQAELRYWNGKAWLNWPGIGRFPFDYRVSGAEPIIQ